MNLGKRVVYMRDTEHYIELMMLYDTTDGEKLIKAMQEDIVTISKELKQDDEDDDHDK